MGDHADGGEPVLKVHAGRSRWFVPLHEPGWRTARDGAWRSTPGHDRVCAQPTDLLLAKLPTRRASFSTAVLIRSTRKHWSATATEKFSGRRSPRPGASVRHSR